jgi:CheY-like chemotaxis protein/HPt (histidine-containing phosphotransfer) domain-containing protein
MNPVTRPDILVVEDSKTQARMLQFLLEEHHYPVRLAEHGQAALENIQAHAFLPWLVLCDIFMPGLNGFDLCRRLRAHPDWRNIRVVLMTATQDPAEIVPIMECGADAFLTKPIQEDHLLQTLALWSPSVPSEASDPGLETPLSFQLQGRSIQTSCRNLTNALTSYYRECAHLNSRVANLQREAGENQLWFESLLNALPGPACVVTARNEILASNPEFFLTLQRQDRSPLTGLPCQETLPRNLADRLEDLKATVAQTGRTATDPQTLHLPPAFSPWSLSLTPLNDRTAQAIGYLIRLQPVSSEPGPDHSAPPSPEPLSPPAKTRLLDTHDGLNRLGGNEAIYRKVLKVFYEENRETREKVLAALNSGDHETLHRLVHTVKGASGNISATELYTQAAQTESLIRSGALPLEAPIRIFLECLDRLLDTLTNVEKLSLK